MSKSATYLRTGVVVVLLLMTGVYVHTRERLEVIPSHADLQGFPMSVSDWRGRSVEIDQRTLDILGAGEFTERYYTNASTAPGIDLFIGYFPSQRAAVAVHSPQNCLPGSGWFPVTQAVKTLNIAGRNLQFKRMVVSNGSQKMMVLYTYYAHGRGTASEYTAKYRLIRDAIVTNRTDGGLVRIITQIVPGDTEASAEARVVAFAQEAMPEMTHYIPD